MRYWILPASGIQVSRTTIKCVTYIETCIYDIKKCFEVYDKAIKDIFYEKYTEYAFTEPSITNPTMEM